eukprot:TRINITY_DN58006_c0_g1_i1.p1 TRINITY_DN58006_c0_g1~~TRINITY_DN58006_c0_g1_i1.p1  ORF type:complete len:204 (+),score=32.96 TRINITY_DN58006_c0_g1_i1:260-871(+)
MPEAWSIADVLLPMAAKLGLTCSSGGPPLACGDSNTDAADTDAKSPANNFVVPLPAVQLEGPADLPRAVPIDVQPFGSGSRKAQASFRMRTPAVQSRHCAPPAESPKEVQPSRIFKFYPQPSDDLSKAAVDVIEHGFEVLIVRREPSPSRKCPASILPQGDGEQGELDSKSMKQHHSGASNSLSRGRSPGLGRCKVAPGELSV